MRTLTLTDEDLAVIDQALQRMPYGQVVGVYQRINQQLAAAEPDAAELERMIAVQDPPGD